MRFDEVLDSTPTANKVAFSLIVLAKLAGMGAVGFVVAGFKIAAFSMLGLAALLLTASVILSIQEMGRQNRKDLEDEDVIRRLIKDGTLATRLREAGYNKCLNLRDASDTSLSLSK